MSPQSLQHNGTVYVSFSSQIDAHSTEALLGLMANLVMQRVKTVHLHLSTPGGTVMHGLNLYNMLRGMPFDLITHNVGNVDSIGTTVFLAGKKRYACPHSTFMFHGVGLDVTGPFRMEEKFLKEKLNGIEADHRRIGALIAERTDITREAAAELFLQMQTKDATFAASCGIVHEIRDVQIPDGSTVIALVFQRQGV